jgi:hypothetical protein
MNQPGKPPSGGAAQPPAGTPGQAQAAPAGGPEIKKPKKKLNLDIKEVELKLEKMVAAA